MNEEQANRTMENGESLMWDKTSEQTLAEFMDFAKHGLAVHYGYNFIVGCFENEKQIRKRKPVAMGACRGVKEVGELFIMFSDRGLLCMIARINGEHQELAQNVTAN